MALGCRCPASFVVEYGLGAECSEGTLTDGPCWELAPFGGRHAPPLALLFSYWQHPGLGSEPAWTKPPHGMAEPRWEGAGAPE